jgi:UDP-3-O-[3-hydroxymyristoyl] glucosamine N-acyltransferase
MIAGNTQIAGNVVMGENVWIGPSVTIADGLSIGKNSKVLIGSLVTTPVAEGQTVSGNFALDHSKQLKHFAYIKKNF